MGYARMAMSAAALLLLASCTSSSTSDDLSPTPSRRAFELDGTPMKPCSVGGFEAVCGDLVVPEDRADPSGRQIPMHVVVIPSLDEAPAADPVFFLTGGPGGAATADWSSAPATFPGVHARHDIVLVDQRGTGGSNLLMFPEPPDVTGLSAPEVRERLVPWLEATLEDLGADPRFYTTAAAADDLDDVRAALGYDRIDLYGSSYGATLAQYYVRQHEDRVRAVVLDGGSLVDVPMLELMPARSQEALDSVLARCAADAECHEAFPDPSAQLTKAMRRLRQHPVESALTDPISGEPIVVTADVLSGQIHDLIKTGRSGEVPRLIGLAAAGIVEPVAELARAAAQAGDPARLVLYWSVLCSESWAALDPDETAELSAGSYLLPVSLVSARNLALGCSLLPPASLPPGDGAPVRSDVPVLLLTGSEDPQDPPANVMHAPRELPNSLTVVVPSQGHVVGYLGCLPDVVAAFVEAGSVEGLEVECVGAIPPPPFSTGV